MKPLVAVGASILILAGVEAGTPPPREVTPAAAAADGRRTDLAHFRTHVLAQDRSYSAAAREEAEARLARLDSDASDASRAYFELEIARIVGLADNGHTTSFAGPRSRRFNRVEIRLVPFLEDFYVLRAKEPNADLLGARLVAIDDQPLAKLREVSRSLAGGTPAWRDRPAAYFFESPEQMQALGVISQRDAATYRFESAQGGTIERRLVAEAANRDRARGNADRWIYPELMKSEIGIWRTLLAADKAPWALREPDAAFRWRDAPEMGALVLEMRECTDRDNQSIDTFMRDMTRRLREKPPANLVLDMRMNGGGDLTRTREFMRSLPRLVSGRIFVLTSTWTFSAAISSVGYLEQAAPDRVVIIGEPVGDRLQFWAEGRIVELPDSHAVILYATERHDYLTGCRPFSDCHSQVKRHPIAVTTLAPDLPAPWTIEAYRAGRDPGMEAVEAALRSAR